MYRRNIALCLMCLTAAAILGCQPTLVIPITKSRPQPIAVLRHYNGSDPGFQEPMILLINKAEDLNRLGSYDLVNSKINFAKESLLLLTLGEQPTSGYWARITGIQRKGGLIYVQGMANRPGENETVTQALTYPYDAAVIKKIYSGELRSEIESVSGRPAPSQWVP